MLLGKTSALNKRHLQAISAYQEAARLTPNDPEIWYEMGVAHANANNRRGATEVYEQLKRIDPKRAEGFEKEVMQKTW